MINFTPFSVILNIKFFFTREFLNYEGKDFKPKALSSANDFTPRYIINTMHEEGTLYLSLC